MHFSRGQKFLLAFLATLVGCVLSVFFLDRSLAHILTPDQYEVTYRPVRELTEVGVSSHFFILAVLGFFLSWVAIKKNIQAQRAQALKEWCLSLFLSLLGSGFVLQVLKFVVGRQRPHRSSEHDPFVFDPFTSNWHFHSFPSGHTQTLFTVATALAWAFPRVRVPIYLLAGVISLTRVLLREHFFSDLLMGAYVGCAVTLWVFAWRSRQRNPIDSAMGPR